MDLMAQIRLMVKVSGVVVVKPSIVGVEITWAEIVNDLVAAAEFAVWENWS